MTWTDLTDPLNPDLDRLAAEHCIHPLHVEDCRKRHQRAKVEEGTGYLFVVLKTVRFLEDKELEVHDLDVIVGSDWVITVQEGNQHLAHDLCSPIHAQEGSLRSDQVLYRVADAIVDSYLQLIDTVDDVIDELEQAVLRDPSPAVLSRIFGAKRSLIDLRRIVVNTRDVAAYLYRTENALIGRDLTAYFRDIYDHVARNQDLIETQRELLAATMDVYLSSVANRTNQVMKVLTVLSTVTIPAIVVSSFFGMNTKGLPLADSPYATWFAGLLMAGLTAALLGMLRWMRWL